jgi:hypothetical protein
MQALKPFQQHPRYSSQEQKRRELNSTQYLTDWLLCAFPAAFKTEMEFQFNKVFDTNCEAHLRSLSYHNFWMLALHTTIALDFKGSMIRFLHRNKQLPNESVSAYKTRIRPVMDALPTRFEAPEVREAFFQSFRPDLRPTMIGYHPTEYEDGNHPKPTTQFRHAYFAERHHKRTLRIHRHQ